MAMGKIGAKIAKGAASVSPLGYAMGALTVAQIGLGLKDRRDRKKAFEKFEGSGEVQNILSEGKKSVQDLKTGNLGPSLAQKRQSRMEARQARRGQSSANRADAKRLQGATPFGSGAAGKALDRIRGQEAETDVAIASQIDKDARQKAIAERQFARANVERALQMKQNLASQEASIPGLAQSIVDPLSGLVQGVAKSGALDDTEEKRKGRMDRHAARRASRIGSAE
tara:strand:+ start:697 stop:1374 length:678 start_codon:yes stop_codon:yes gene_type:complete